MDKMLDHDRVEEINAWLSGVVVAVEELIKAVGVISGQNPEVLSHMLAARDAMLIARSKSDAAVAVGVERYEELERARTKPR